MKLIGRQCYQFKHAYKLYFTSEIDKSNVTFQNNNITTAYNKVLQEHVSTY